MFPLKQLLKQLLLPPIPWIVLLLVVVIFWPRRWAKVLLIFVTTLIFLLHNGFLNNKLRYPLESRYPMLLDPHGANPYDAIVVLTAHVGTPTPLTPFPALSESMLHRLEEAWRLYRIQPKPIVVSGGWLDPDAPMHDDNKYAREHLLRWGVPEEHILSEADSRDTFESALQVGKILGAKGWRRYLLVTSAVHMPRSMLAFAAVAPEPIAAPGDFTVRLKGGGLLPSESAAERITAAVHEYVGLVYYHWRVWRWKKTKDEEMNAQIQKRADKLDFYGRERRRSSEKVLSAVHRDRLAGHEVAQR